MATSPNPLNYYIGKGNVYVKLAGDVDYVHVGNCPEFEFTPELEELAHNSSMAGVRTRDRTIVIEKTATLRMVLEEWTTRNLALALLGLTEQDSQGRDVIDIFAQNAVQAQVKFVGSNEVGPRWEIELLRVDFIPSGSVNPISEEWGSLEVTGNVATVDGKFGTATKLGEEGETATEAPSA